MSFKNLSLILTSKRYNILTILTQPAVALSMTNPLKALKKRNYFHSTIYQLVTSNLQLSHFNYFVLLIILHELCLRHRVFCIKFEDPRPLSALMTLTGPCRHFQFALAKQQKSGCTMFLLSCFCFYVNQTVLVMES